MSAEAHRNTGSVEGFANRLQQIANDSLARQKQQKVDERNTQAVRVTAAAASKEEAARKQREREEFLKTRKTEGLKVLHDFQIEKRLKYIQKTVWEGKGGVRSVLDEDLRYSDRGVGTDWFVQRAGFELVHQYPGSRKVTEYYSSESGGDYSIDRYVPYTGVTRLRVLVIDLEHESGESEIALLEISSATYSPSEADMKRGIRSFTNFLEINIPAKAEDSVVQLEQALLCESITRVDSGFLPNQWETRGSRELTEARRNSKR
ncbi:MAG: hypothetical protein ABIC96_03865 [Patescibacteria group bacterium]